MRSRRNIPPAGRGTTGIVAGRIYQRFCPTVYHGVRRGRERDGEHPSRFEPK